jgi:hypothetical protein
MLANAYFDGYNGSATRLPGVIAYVSSQLDVKAPAASQLGINAPAVSQLGVGAPAAGAAVPASRASRVAVAPAGVIGAGNGLHTLRPVVNLQTRPTVLPPDLFDQCAKLSFWHDDTTASRCSVLRIRDTANQGASVSEAPLS